MNFSVECMALADCCLLKCGHWSWSSWPSLIYSNSVHSVSNSKFYFGHKRQCIRFIIAITVTLFVILECVAYFLNFVGVVRTEIFTLATDLTIILVHQKKKFWKEIIRLLSLHHLTCYIISKHIISHSILHIVVQCLFQHNLNISYHHHI
jgi:hypothetical protein